MRDQGHYIGGRNKRYGYDIKIVEGKKIYEINTEEQLHIECMCRLRSELDIPPYVIAEIMFQEGIRNTSGKKFGHTEVGRLLKRNNIGTTSTQYKYLSEEQKESRKELARRICKEFTEKKSETIDKTTIEPIS
jgi:hypothetical protein